MRRLIVTGANGVGKSHLAARLGRLRPDIQVFCHDAMKLTRDWTQRPRREAELEVSRVLAMDGWVLEGGPSLLALGLGRAEGVIWLDPPELVRAWRLMVRPWRNFGATRAELPPGNIDWPLQQYRFALRSLWRRRTFRRQIAACLAASPGVRLWHCRDQRGIDRAMEAWRGGMEG